jgi:opacity protein-like surface antigen
MPRIFRSAAVAVWGLANLAAGSTQSSAQNSTGQQAFQGAYFGIAPHYAWAKSDVTLSRPGFPDVTGSKHLAAPAFAAFGGYDWRIGTGTVFGVIGDLGVAKFSNTKLAPIGAVRGRLGQALTPDLLLFATGGRAFALQTTTGTLGGADFIASKTVSGWTYGGGVEKEAALGGRPIRLGLEVLRHDLNKFEFDAGTRHVAIINGVWSVSARAAFALQ